MVRKCYEICVGAWGIQPSEFWSMDVEEFWWLYEYKRPRDPKKDYAGSLTKKDVRELVAELEEKQRGHANGS